MLRIRRTLLGLGLALAAALAVGVGTVGAANANVAVNGPIPAFRALDADGRTVTQANFAGKAVIFEWTNHDCPFVKRHYNVQNMQGLMRAAEAQSVVWVQVISSAPGEQGHVDAAAAKRLNATRNAGPSMVLLDPSGAMGRAFEAKTTPHMFVFNAAGRAIYQGAIDDAPRGSEAGVASARNYVREALTAVRANAAPSVQVTPPYGCSVKYARQ